MTECKSDGAGIHFAGIRHHGPGTSRALKKWLDTVKPDLILLECPSDTKTRLDELNPSDLRPPVALVVYSNHSAEESMMLPFASFSPEWISILYAKENKIELFPIDLPSYAWKESKDEKSYETIEKEPLKMAFQSAGIEDQEKWWDSSIEESEDSAEVFKSIAELMENWRALEKGVNPLNELREAYMRTEIFNLSKKNKGKKIAVITGAYHIPAVTDFQTGISEDVKKINNIKKQKAEVCWIPWSYQRLSSASGYGAGIEFPSWFEHLYHYGFSAPDRWLVKAAEVLRKKGIYVSTAEVMDCLDLCLKLVQIRGNQHPSLTDLKYALRCSVLQGKEEFWGILKDELLIGQSFGSLGNLKDEHPIRKDFETQVKKFRLTSFLSRKDRKSRKLDLRKEAHLELSFFLHRLNLLGIYLGTLDLSDQSEYSNFSESWVLEWSEDEEINLIQAGIYGNTIEEAIINLSGEQVKKERSLVKLSETMIKLLLAGMTTEVTKYLREINRLAIVSLDIAQLIPLCRQLALGSKYGNIRNYPANDLISILMDLIPRVLGIFPSHCIQADEKKAKQSLEELILLKNISGILDNDEVSRLWDQLLLHLEQDTFTHPLIKGAALRLLFDNGSLTPESAESKISLALRSPGEPLEKSHWLEGLLSFGVLGLLYEKHTISLLNQFVSDLDEEEFKEVLPSLKRSFGRLSKNEKQRLFKKISFFEEIFPNSVLTTKVKLSEESRQNNIPELVKLILN